jgi:hypothetical protein
MDEDKVTRFTAVSFGLLALVMLGMFVLRSSLIAGSLLAKAAQHRPDIRPFTTGPQSRPAKRRHEFREPFTRSHRPQLPAVAAVPQGRALLQSGG